APDDFVDSYQEISNDATILTSNICIKIASEDISLDTTFPSWNEVENFLENYGYQNGFAINKYRMERNKSSNIITKRTFTCEFDGKFKSKKKESSIQVEKQNNI
ncbi:14712_t:CDS:1, partial [Funneliformis mosseae]